MVINLREGLESAMSEICVLEERIYNLRLGTADYQERISKLRKDLSARKKDLIRRGVCQNGSFASDYRELDRLRGDFTSYQSMARVEGDRLLSRAKELSSKVNVIEMALDLENSEPKVYKDVSNGEKIYSLWINNSLVYCFHGEDLFYLHSTRLDRPLRIATAKTKNVLSFGQGDLIRLLEVSSGDYITGEGIGLTGRAQEVSHAIFEHVRNGVEIFPNSDIQSGYKILLPRDRQNGSGGLQPRHWGQEFLQGMNPDRITQGELFGSRLSYLAYHLNGRVVAEANLELHGTYVFESEEAFERLRAVPRERLLSERPDGFLGRIVHNGEPDRWKEDVRRYLDK
jgi:hypothetical protein